MSKITFDCGTFLPGEGPGNVPDFEGGGTIDAGGGGGNPNVDPIDPLDPIDPIIVDDGGGDPPPIVTGKQ